MKSYTDLSQSKTLSNILPLESADMWYSYYGNSKYNPTIAYKGQQWFLCQIRNSLHDDVPCWGLASLFSVLPERTRLLKSTNISSIGDTKYHCECPKANIDKWFDNAVDACVATIEHLHELKML